MNFRLNKWKVIVSIVVAILSFILIDLYSVSLSDRNRALMLAVVLLILTYFIWSLFEKKEKEVKRKRK